MKSEEVIDVIHKQTIELQKTVVQLENSRAAQKQAKLIAFKFHPSNENHFFVSGNINGLLTLIRTLVQALVTFGYEKKKLDTLKFPEEVLTNSDYFLTGINVIDDFFEIEKIKIAKPTIKDFVKFYFHLISSWGLQIIRIGLMILGLFYILEHWVFV